MTPASHHCIEVTYSGRTSVINLTLGNRSFWGQKDDIFVKLLSEKPEAHQFLLRLRERETSSGRNKIFDYTPEFLDYQKIVGIHHRGKRYQHLYIYSNIKNWRKLSDFLLDRNVNKRQKDQAIQKTVGALTLISFVAWKHGYIYYDIQPSLENNLLVQKVGSRDIKVWIVDIDGIVSYSARTLTLSALTSLGSPGFHHLYDVITEHNGYEEIKLFPPIMVFEVTIFLFILKQHGYNQRAFSNNLRYLKSLKFIFKEWIKTDRVSNSYTCNRMRINVTRPDQLRQLFEKFIAGLKEIKKSGKWVGITSLLYPIIDGKYPFNLTIKAP